MNGFLLVDKPSGWTSHDVVARVRRILQTKKIGHTGTLDPLATGLLVLAVGTATKSVRFVESDPKVYEARGILGVTTTTLDSQGDVVNRRDVNVSRDEMAAALKGFEGRIVQVPPRVSAIKIDGERAYKRDARGEDFVMPQRQVDIHSISLDEFAAPDFSITVSCSPGTYIRTLIADVGDKLGCGAHMSGLRRTRAGDLWLRDAVTLENLSADDLVATEEVVHGNPSRV